jgi:mono/diheme cytochrome c family protein
MRATLTALVLVVTLAGATAMMSYTMQAPTKAPAPTAPPAAKAPTATAAAAPARANTVMTDAQLTEVVKKNCVTCHKDATKGNYGDLSLEKFDVAAAVKNGPTTERMIRKLRAGMMPPPPMKLAPEVHTALVDRLEGKMDMARPEPRHARVSALESRGIQVSDQGPARPRCRSGKLAAAGHHER